MAAAYRQTNDPLLGTDSLSAAGTRWLSLGFGINTLP
jgi:hypothetical protein